MKNLGALFGTAFMILVGTSLVPAIANMVAVALESFNPLELLPIAMIGAILGLGFYAFSGIESIPSTIANATTGITLEALSLQSWNCKNCGGPNVEQVKCQYCGMVKE